MIPWKNLVLFLALTCLLFLGIPIRLRPQVEVDFDDYLRGYNKSYSNETVYRRRLEAFKKSLQTIEQLNRQRTSNESALYGITRYSDMFVDEFRDHHLQTDYSQRSRLLRSARYDIQPRKRSVSNLPRKIDWRKSGAVSSVNNQYSCGACWAFSAVEIIESMNSIRGNGLRKLSTQQLIDCAGYTNEGCDGGDVCSLLAWLKDFNVTIEFEDVYPLRWKNEKCKMKGSVEGVRVAEYYCEMYSGNEHFLLTTIANHGPIAVAINALSWQNYLGGVIQYHCNSHPLLLNHAVQIVGYNLDADIPHYIVRNSWGPDFGDGGYLYIAIGRNLCGLANEVSFVNVS